MSDDSADKCSIKKCDLSIYSRGYCRNHYEQARRNGEFDGSIFTGDYVLLEHEQKIYPEGYADRHRPKWHRRGGER